MDKIKEEFYIRCIRNLIKKIKYSELDQEEKSDEFNFEKFAISIEKLENKDLNLLIMNLA